jgi:hypothetical protein
MTKIKLLLVTICITLIPSLLYSQVTIFSENFGTPAATTSVATYTGFQNYGVQTYTGNADVRTTAASSGYVGASGGGNLFVTNALNTNCIISGINTTNYNTLSLSLGLLKTTNASNGSQLGIQVSSNGTTWTDLSFTMATGGGSSNVYVLYTPTGTIPSTANLRIRFIMKSVVTGLQFRIDDIKLTGVMNVVLPLTLGSFTAQKTKKGNMLMWETYNEENVDKFVIMKSVDGYEWKEIGVVKARGNTFFKELYAFVDGEISTFNYYQLFIYDNDGTYTTSKVVATSEKTGLTIPKKFYNILGQEILYEEEYGIPGQ